jgi:cupin 2 domain-containing protein
MKFSNIFEAIPNDLSNEVFQNIVSSSNIRIERIISKGHASPESGWYDQDENEWVMVIDGKATIAFENGTSHTLARGDYLNIPAHCKHKVSWSDPNQMTMWLAVFYQ